MGELAEAFQSLTPGFVLAVLSAVLALVMVLVFLLPGKKTRLKSGSRIVPSGQADTPAKPLVQVSPEIDRIWAEAVRSMQALEQELGQELTNFEKQLLSEREEVESKTEALKSAALEKRVPLTLYELYEGMRHFGKKSPKAQQSDLEWHAKIGVTDLHVAEISSKLIPGKEIYFKLDGEAFSILGTHHRYSQTSFIELSLYDAEDLLLAKVRVKPQEEGFALLEQAVISMKPGAWLQRILGCRAKMDLRHQQVSLLTQHRDVQQLKESFAIKTNISTPL